MFIVGISPTVYRIWDHGTTICAIWVKKVFSKYNLYDPETVSNLNLVIFMKNRNPNSADLSPDEITLFSASFAKKVNLIGLKFLSKLHKDRTVTFKRKKEFSEHIVPLLNFVARQHA